MDGGSVGGTLAYPGLANGSGAFVMLQADLRACTAPPTPGAGLVFYDTTDESGSFKYWGYEFATPDFVQCMKEKGYKLDTAGRNELTNFGQR